MSGSFSYTLIRFYLIIFFPFFTWIPLAFIFAGRPCKSNHCSFTIFPLV